MRNTLEAQIAEMLLRPDLRPSRTGIGSPGERDFAGLIKARGGIPADSGWPDFAVFGKNGRLKALVEVKPDSGRWKPRENQLAMLLGFASAGIPSFVWSPSSVVKINQDCTAQSASQDELTGLL